MAQPDRARHRHRRPLNQFDTIFALASGAPPAAIAIIRISGPAAFAAATRMAGRLPAPRRAALRRLRDADGELLDQALVLAFPGAESATGEDLVELHCHGGRAVVSAVERALDSMATLRRARGGEFTRRALLNGRIDLAQAEALGDLLRAETEQERLAAIAGVEGELSRRVSDWQARMIALSAQIEASIEFEEEGDVASTAASMAMAEQAMTAIREEMSAMVSAPTVERLRDGFRVVLAGPRNAGKSTLFNLLVGRDAAIVSPIAGTTRDRIEAPVQRDGVGYLLIDTAGLVEWTEDQIEATGIALTRKALDGADVILWLDDTSPTEDNALWVWSKADLPDRLISPRAAIAVRGDDQATITCLWDRIAAIAGRQAVRSQVALNERQRRHVMAALDVLRPADDILVLAEHLRMAIRQFQHVTHADRTEAMLDRLFGDFCIGK